MRATSPPRAQIDAERIRAGRAPALAAAETARAGRRVGGAGGVQAFDETLLPAFERRRRGRRQQGLERGAFEALYGAEARHQMDALHRHPVEREIGKARIARGAGMAAEKARGGGGVVLAPGAAEHADAGGRQRLRAALHFVVQQAQAGVGGQVGGVDRSRDKSSSGAPSKRQAARTAEPQGQPLASRAAVDSAARSRPRHRRRTVSAAEGALASMPRSLARRGRAEKRAHALAFSARGANMGRPARRGAGGPR